MHKIFLILAMTFVFSSCSLQDETRLNENMFFEVSEGDDSFISEMGPYQNYFIGHDGYQGFGYHKSNLLRPTKRCKFGGFTNANPDIESRLDNFFINDYSTRAFLDLSREEQVLYVDKQLGGTAVYRFIENGKEVYNKLMYLPQEISIDTTSSGITRIGATGIANFKLGAGLYINQDVKNENGLLVSLWYRGHNLNITLDGIQNSSEEGINIQKYMYVPKDSGIIEFPNGFFDGLPNGAMFYLQINRLNTLVFNIGKNTHKLSAGTSHGLNFALER